MQPRKPIPSSAPSPVDVVVAVEDTEAARLDPPAPVPVKPAHVSRGERVRRQPVISYYRRMLRGKLYPLDVTIGEEGAKRPAAGQGGSSATGPTIQVQPVVPGAQVSPPAADVATNPGSRVRFWVLPLNRGKLPDARVEFRDQGRLLSNEPLRMKSGTRRLAWFFLLLAIALPAWALYLRASVSSADKADGELGPAGAYEKKVDTFRDWITAKATEVETKGEAETVLDWFYKGLGQANVKAGVVWTYEQVLTIKSFELVLAAPLLLLTFLAWLYTGPALGRKRGKVIEVG
jgi:hypothetical protein